MSGEDNKRIAKNTAMLYVRMLLTMLVTLYTSRVILNTLGVEDFGIYNLVGGIVVLFSFFNSAMSMATQRFLNYEMGRGTIDSIKRVFSMSMIVHFSIIIFILLLAETIGLWFLNTYLNIPEERIEAANWVYQFSILTFSIKVIQVPYNASIIAHEKMTFYAYISIVEVILKLLIVLVLPWGGVDRLILYSSLVCGVTILIFLCYRYYCLKHFVVCLFHFIWDAELYKRLISFSGWTLLGQVAVVGVNQGINFILNIFFGVIVNAAMGIGYQVVNAIQSFVSNFQTAFKPQLMKSYAAGDHSYLFQLVTVTSRFSFFLLFILAVPVLYNTEFILRIWLKQVPEYSVTFCQLLIINSLIEALAGPLWMSVHATGKIKNYQIIISLLYLLNLCFSYFFLLLGYYPEIVLWIKLFVGIIILFVRIVFCQKLIKLPVKTYFEKTIRLILPVIIIALPFPYLLKSYLGEVEYFFASLIGGSIIIIIAIYYCGITRLEREHVNKYTKIFLSKIRL